MDKELYTQIENALDDRESWETKQTTWYQMRNGGIRRRSKPYPNAPDMHYPLGDGMIEKLKPAYIQQLVGAETIASFISLKQQTNDITSAAAYWFDYQLKQRSNYERTMFIAIDEMLQDAFCPVKVYWDEKCKRLAFDQVDPLHLIVPTGCEEFNANGGTDWVVHVIHLSEAEYRANEHFDQDDNYIKTIKGKGKEDDTAKRASKELREGINCSDNDNEIVLWEVYNRDRKGKRITVETVSPLRPIDSEPVRAPFQLPYNKGVFKGGQFPFFKIRAELKGKGHYSPRGIIEINAPFEASLCKEWNTLLEHMDFHGRPRYQSTQPIANAVNVKTGPGSILPPGLTAAESPPPPVFIREDMAFTRALAEDRTQVPDLGASEHLTGKPGESGKVTATQINAIVGQSGQGNDMRARVFRLDVAEGLNMAWSLCLQYAIAGVDENGQIDQKSLTYVVDSEIKTLDQNAIHEEYEIVPNGSADSWNKSAEFAKYAALYQTLQGNPYIDAGEGTKLFLEKVDPRLVKRLYRDPGVQTQNQMEDQAVEIGLMLLGFSAQVSPADDDKAHLQCIGGFIQRRLSQNEPITPEFARLVLTHGSAHAQAMEQKKDPMAKQIEAQAMPIIQILGHIAQSDQAGNVIPMPGSGGNGAASTPNGSSPSSGPATPIDPIDDATKLMNAVANLIKAGVPITNLEINQMMARAGLAPLGLTAPAAVPEPMEGETPVNPTEAARPSDGMVNPAASRPAMSENTRPINVINIATRKKIKVTREKDGSITGEVFEVPHGQEAQQ